MRPCILLAFALLLQFFIGCSRPEVIDFPVTEVSAPESKPIEFETPEGEATRPVEPAPEVTPVSTNQIERPADAVDCPTCPSGWRIREPGEGVLQRGPILERAPVQRLRGLPVIRRFGRR